MTTPNFFIVGAPKCGTTALYHCLRNHPEVFMPFSRDHYWLHKEPMHFCDDLGIADWLRVTDEADYAQLFAKSGDAKRVGEATPMYLLSESAAGRIRQRCDGDVKIIIMLRPPIEWMRSWHHDLLRYGYEDVGSFREALKLEDAREAGDGLPRRAAYSGCLNYSKAACFKGQVERMFETFGRRNVFVGLMEDMALDQKKFVAEILRFLGVDDSIVPEIKRKNDSSTLRRTHLFDLAVSRVADRTPGGKLARKLWKAGPGRLYFGTIDRVFSPLSDKSIEPSLQLVLGEEFRNEVAALGELLGRDLSHWGDGGT